MQRTKRSGFLGRARYARRALHAIASDPYEGVERALERFAESGETRHGPWVPEVEPHPDERLHAALGANWPCETCAGFEEVWRRVTASLRQRGLQVGRGVFGGWDDADGGLARIVWALARHREPDVVVETGVARGLTSAVILEALERNGTGRLWSIDLPPLLEPPLSEQTGAAVRHGARHRWTLLRGSSRRLLPGLFAGLERIDLLVHDSMHTGRNVRFELRRAWPVLSPGGAVVVDAIEKNGALEAFRAAHPDALAIACAADDEEAYFGCLLKQPVAES